MFRIVRQLSVDSVAEQIRQDRTIAFLISAGSVVNSHEDCSRGLYDMYIFIYNQHKFSLE
jgi:hypothetical protein